ncbi:MAG: DUF881 domain-containing protein [Clostridiaceae bacterium]|nr:DUF881 domain-containing protein [Clostridiaceae bacterium]
MEKNKITMISIIGIICVILVAVMFAQFKTVEETDITGIETAREEELQMMLSSWKTKYEEVEEKLIDTQQKITDYREKLTSNEQTSELLDKELEQINILVGKTNVTGQGVIITLKNNEEKTIEASDLRTLINELKLAGAEAISINDKRILNMTEIVDVNGIILINEDRIVSPYIVKAIGDQTYLSSALSLKTSGFIDSYQKLGKTVEMTKENKISILAYNSKKNQLQLKYAKEVQE